MKIDDVVEQVLLKRYQCFLKWKRNHIRTN